MKNKNIKEQKEQPYINRNPHRYHISSNVLACLLKKALIRDYPTPILSVTTSLYVLLMAVPDVNHTLNIV